jgi:hypothetical protein
VTETTASVPSQKSLSLAEETLNFASTKARFQLLPVPPARVISLSAEHSVSEKNFIELTPQEAETSYLLTIRIRVDALLL